MEFEALIKKIEDEYSRLEHSLSWRFLTSPRSTLSSETDFVFLTLNPGGDKLLTKKIEKVARMDHHILLSAGNILLPERSRFRSKFNCFLSF